MSTRIFFIRHGETIWNQEKRSQGFTDIPLSQTGENQARALAQALKSPPLAAVYSSDLIRARRTAEIIAEPHRLQVRSDARFRELNQGEIEGQRLEDLLSGHPELLKQWMDAPAEVTMPGGESLRTLQARAGQAVEEIRRKHPDARVAVVAHNLCLLTVICQLIGLDLNLFRRLRLDNASISEFDFSARGPVLLRLNDIHHLPR